MNARGRCRAVMIEITSEAVLAPRGSRPYLFLTSPRFERLLDQL